MNAVKIRIFPTVAGLALALLTLGGCGQSLSTRSGHRRISREGLHRFALWS